MLVSGSDKFFSYEPTLVSRDSNTECVYTFNGIKSVFCKINDTKHFVPVLHVQFIEWLTGRKNQCIP